MTISLYHREALHLWAPSPSPSGLSADQIFHLILGVNGDGIVCG